MAKKEEKKDKMVEVTVTQEMLDANPTLATEENGIVVGDVIEVTEAEAAALSGEGDKKEEKKEDKKAAKASKGAMAVIKNGEYIRTYSADQSEELASFLSKDSAYEAVPDESIAEVEVPYEVKNTDGTINRTAKRFTDKSEAILFKNEHRSNVLVVASK